jgi:chromosomal replication initiation ATPase DnaA
VLEDLAPEVFDEQALFHLLNMVREEAAFLLLTARAPLTSWNAAVPDLGSRLRAIPAVTLAAPDDGLLRAVIVKLFADRQIAVERDLPAYLVSRIERSFPAARAAVEALDREALRRKRPVNRALAAELLRDRPA